MENAEAENVVQGMVFHAQESQPSAEPTLEAKHSDEPAGWYWDVKYSMPTPDCQKVVSWFWAVFIV